MESNSTGLIAKNGSTTASKLLRSEKYSDLTIVCHGRRFKVHKAILCPQSEVISTMCDADMQERNTGIIEHKEFDADTMERMIDFAYEKTYEVTRRPRYEPAEDTEASIATMGSLTIEDASTPGSVTLSENDDNAPTPDDEPAELSATDKMVVHARVYGLADYYDMPELRIYAYRCFMSVTNYGFEDIDLTGFDDVARQVCKTTMGSDGSAGNSYEGPLRSGFLSLVAQYAPKLANDGDFAAALHEPDLQGMFADTFRALGKMIAEVEEERDVNTSTLYAKKQALENSLAFTEWNADRERAAAQYQLYLAEEQVEHQKKIMQRLVESLKTLPESCASNHCSSGWASLMVEQKEDGEYQVRCGSIRCSARLN